MYRTSLQAAQFPHICDPRPLGKGKALQVNQHLGVSSVHLTWRPIHLLNAGLSLRNPLVSHMQSRLLWCTYLKHKQPANIIQGNLVYIMSSGLANKKTRMPN
jgi:hypothetical protein